MSMIERIFVLILLTLPFAGCGLWAGIGFSVVGQRVEQPATQFTSTHYEILSNIRRLAH